MPRCKDCKAKRSPDELKTFNGLCLECYYDDTEILDKGDEEE